MAVRVMAENGWIDTREQSIRAILLGR